MPSPAPLLSFLTELHTSRTNRQIVVPTMGAAREWMKLGSHPLDFIYAPSAMGQAPSLGLGLALAQPERQIIVLNGDGCQLMNLGCLVTISGQSARNFVLIVCDNAAYEVTGNQATAASPAARPLDRRVSFAEIARGCGMPAVFEFDSPSEWSRALTLVLSTPGPCFVVWKVAVDPAGNVPRSPSPAPTRAREFQRTLTGANEPS